MFGLLKRRLDHKGRIGLAIDRDRLGVAVVGREGGTPVLLRCEVLPVDAGAGAEGVAAAVRAAGLPRLPVSTVLNSTDYQVVLVEAPDVPPAELRAAMRWRLKDAIDFRIEEAVIDVFEVPVQQRGSQGRMMYAVAARRGAVDLWSAALASTGNFDVVDVPELCLRNLASCLPGVAGGIALLHFGETTATVVLVRGPTFYFARQMDLRAGGLDTANVVLELQRSLDYYERHFDQPPITRIALSPGGSRAGILSLDLKRETGFDVTALDLNSLMQCSSPVDAGTQAACLMAVGAALREERVTL